MIDIENSILETIDILKDLSRQLDNSAKEKVDSLMELTRKYAKCIAKLKNGVEMEFEKEVIKNPPVTLILKLADGFCIEEKSKSELANEYNRNLHKKIDIYTHKLTALMSINRKL